LTDTLPTSKHIVQTNEIHTSLVSSSSLTVENSTNDKDTRKEAALDRQGDSNIDETDSKGENDDLVLPSNQVSTSTVGDLAYEDKKENANDELNDKRQDDQEPETLVNGVKFQEDAENSATSKSQDSYNVDEACPIVDDLDLSETSDEVCSEDIKDETDEKEDLQKEISAEIQIQVRQ
jgi:hypothetical protein